MDPATTAAATDSVSQLLAGGGIALSGAVVYKLIDLGAKMWASRNQKSTVGPQPFEVRAAEKYVRDEDFREYCRMAEKRHDQLAESIAGERQSLTENLSGIRKQLSSLDAKAETRSVNLHNRMDPLIDAVGNLQGRVDDHIKSPYIHKH